MVDGQMKDWYLTQWIIIGFFGFSLTNHLYIYLTPKGPTCIFWQHRNFRQVRVIGELHILG